MLNNNIKILLVSFVHHIELQNFLNAPRIYGIFPYGAAAIVPIWCKFKSRYTETRSDPMFVHECTG